MKVAKLSRNQARSRAYKMQADSSIRNEIAIGDKPLIGHFEMRTHETVTTYGEDGEPAKVRTKRLAVPFMAIVHDSDATAARGKAPKSRNGKGGEGRRMRAQERCSARNHLPLYNPEGRKNVHNGRCLHCGA